MRLTVRFPVITRYAFACALTLTVPAAVFAQRTPRDSTARDSVGHRSTVLQPVTITTTRAGRDEPTSTTNIAPAMIRLTPAINAWDLVRQVAGIEVHDQGQGPG